MTYPAEYRAAALQLVREIGRKPAARQLGVAVNTLRRWQYPDVAARHAEAARVAKQRRKQPCARGCGNLTSWDRPGGVCVECVNADRAPAHGTVSRYSSAKHRCRCKACREANAAAQRAWYQRHRRVA